MAPINFTEFRVESVGEEVTYHLPIRPLGILRLAALVPIGFSTIWFTGLGNVLLPQFHLITSQPQPHDYIIWALLLGFVLAGCVPAGLGLLILFGRCRVRWREGRLMVSEQLGPLSWPRRIPRQPIRKILVLGGGVGEGNGPPPGSLGSLAALLVGFESGVPRAFVIGYPRPWLEAIAQDLSARAGIAESEPPPQVENDQGSAGEPAAAPVEQPAGSKIVMQQSVTGLRLEVPPAGLWKGSMGLFFLASVWCLFVGAISADALAGGKFELKSIPFLALFWLVGLGMLGIAINLGRRRVVFTSREGELSVVKSGPFGTSQFAFRRPDIADIRAGLSQVEMNHRPLLELQVHLVTGKKTGFLVGRDPDELRWIAAVLNNALGLAAPAQSPATGFAGWPPVGAGSQPTASPIGKFISLLVFAAIVIGFSWPFIARLVVPAHPRLTVQSPAANLYLSNLPVSSDPTLIFNAFGPADSCQSNRDWFIGLAAHAEWFVPTLSGKLSEIKMALVPDPGNPHPGRALVFLAGDRHGFPGHSLESFYAGAGVATNLLTLESVRKPALQAGVKYWLCARSEGGWRWHFNNQNIVHNAARQVSLGKWASAGDYCYVSAFSIRVSTNEPPAAAPTLTGDDPPRPPNN